MTLLSVNGKHIFPRSVYLSMYASSQGATGGLDGAAVYSIIQPADVGVVNRCLSLHPDFYCAPLRAQQSSGEAQSEECIGVRGGGHLEAAGLEQQPQTHPGL